MRKPILLALAILSVFYSCTKIQTTDIGSGLIPPIDGVFTKDTLFTVVTNSFNDDTSARIYKTDDHVIGVINNDPLFGKTTASAFFELKPTFYKYFFPGSKDSLLVDSVVLILSYRGVYGDSSIPQAFNVFEINQNSKLKFDSNYRNNDAIGLGSLITTSPSFDLRRLGDSVKNRFEATRNQIRIKLPDNFRDRLKNFDSTAVGAYSSDSLFRTFFAGFAVVPANANSGQALIRINLTDENTKLGIYYRSKSVGGAVYDTIVNYFRFNLSGSSTTSGSANIITRQRSTSQVASYFNTAPRNDSLVFIQTSPGTFVKVSIPGLSSFPNAIIHRAELIMEQVPEIVSDKTLTPPRYMMLTGFDSANSRKINIRNDYVIDPSVGPNIETSGGFLLYKEVAGFGRVASYTFNLTRYIQGIITRKDISYPLRLYAPSNDSIRYTPPYPAVLSTTTYVSPSSANNIADGRVRLGGGSHSRLRMRLRIIFSRL